MKFLVLLATLVSYGNSQDLQSRILQDYPDCDLLIPSHSKNAQILELLMVQKPMKTFKDMKEINNQLSGSRCHVAIWSADSAKDLDILNNIRPRSMFAAVILTSNSSVGSAAAKMTRTTFDRLSYIKSNNKYELFHEYSASSDRSWRRVKLAIVVHSPYVFHVGRRKVVGTPFDIDIWEMLAMKLKLTMEFIHKQNFEELFTLVETGKADVVAQQSTHNLRRFNQGDLSYPTFTATFKFFNWKPPHAIQLFTLLYPFDSMIWLLLLTSCLLVCMTNVLLNRKRKEYLFQSFGSSICPIINQSIPATWFIMSSSKSDLFRKFWLLCGTLLMFFYTSNLLANLVAVKPGQAVDTFEQLLENKHMLGVMGGSSLLKFMATSNNKVIQQVYQKAVLEQGGIYYGYQVPENLRYRLTEGTASFFAPTYMTGLGKWGLRPGTDILLSSYTGYAYRHGHPLQHQFNYALSILREAGILQHLRDKYIYMQARPDREHERNTPIPQKKIKLNYSHLSLLLMVYGFFIIFGIVSFGLEKLFLYTNASFVRLN